MPVPSPALPALTWNATAAATAQAWANGCSFNHNPGRGSLGENIAFSTGTMTPEFTVQLWASEAQYYTLATNSCVPGQVCGHYTQLVWRNTTSVGCAQANCPAGPTQWRYWVVCNYSPPGNWVGQRPY